jgi:hypothetical protein
LRQKIEEYDTNNPNQIAPPIIRPPSPPVTGKTHEELNNLYPYPEKVTQVSDEESQPKEPKRKAKGRRGRKVTNKTRESQQESQYNEDSQRALTPPRQNAKRPIIELVEDEDDEDEVSRKIEIIQSKIEAKRHKVALIEEALEEIRANHLNNLSYERHPILEVVLQEQFNNAPVIVEPPQKKRKLSDTNLRTSASTAPPPTPPSAVTPRRLSAANSFASPTFGTDRTPMRYMKPLETVFVDTLSQENMEDSIVIEETSRESFNHGRDSETRTELVQRQQARKPGHSYVICGTILDARQKERLEAVGKKLGAKIANKMTSQVTHVVTPVNEQGIAKRTLKLCSGIICGSWVVSTGWIEECLKQQAFADEHAFEVKGDSIAENGPIRGRKARISNESPLFSNLFIYLHGKFQAPNPNKGELKNLIEWGGGTVLSKLPTAAELINNATSSRSSNSPKKTMVNTVIVVDNGTLPAQVQELKTTTGLHPVRFVWLLDSVSAYRVEDRTQFYAKLT